MTWNQVIRYELFVNPCTFAHVYFEGGAWVWAGYIYEFPDKRRILDCCFGSGNATPDEAQQKAEKWLTRRIAE